MSIIGIDIGGTNIRAGLVEHSSITKLLSCKTPAQETELKVLETITSLIEKLMTHSVEAIGIGVPSIVDIKNGIVYDTMNIPSWKKVHLKSYIENLFKVPVLVNNDANCFVAGEKHFGKGRNHNSILGIVMGTGLGAGIIINNKLYEGLHCGAGEIGNIKYLNSNYEYFCSGQYFKGEYNISGQKAFQDATQGDLRAIEMFTRFGEHVGNMIQTALYAYDPECIVLGGSLSNAYSLFQSSMKKTFEDFMFPKILSDIKIEVSELDNIAIYGAVSLYYNSVN